MLCASWLLKQIFVFALLLCTVLNGLTDDLEVDLPVGFGPAHHGTSDRWGVCLKQKGANSPDKRRSRADPGSRFAATERDPGSAAGIFIVS